MEVGGVRRDLEFLLRRDADIVLLLGRGCDGADAKLNGLFIGLLRKGTGECVVAGMFLARKIQRDEGKTLACTARGEDNVIVVAEPHELLDVRLCLLVDFVVGGGAVTGLEDGHARAAEVQQLRLHFPEDILGQNGRAGIEVINAFVHGISPSVRYDFVGASAAERMGIHLAAKGNGNEKSGKEGHILSNFTFLGFRPRHADLGHARAVHA